MVDPLSLLTAGASVLAITSTAYYSTKTILASHEKLSGKVDALVGVLASHQVAIDTVAKDVQIFKEAAAAK